MIETKETQFSPQEQYVPVVEAPVSVAPISTESSEPQVNSSNVAVTPIAEPLAAPIAPTQIEGEENSNNGDVADSGTWLNAFGRKTQGEIPS